MAIEFFDDQESAQRFVSQSGGALRRYSQSNGDGSDTTRWGVEYDSNPNEYEAEGVSKWQQDLAGTPILGWLTGADAALDRGMNLREQRRGEAAWDDLNAAAPSAEDLAVDYQGEGTADNWGDLLGGPSEIRGDSGGVAGQYEALQALRGIVNTGGYSRADQTQRNQAAAANAQRLQGANQAAMQQASARGMGGGGGELAARLMGSQGYAHGQSMADAQIQTAAQQRALAAMQGMGALGSSIDQNELRRQAALDAFNQNQLGWRRDREQRNTQWGNRSRESASTARQTAYENAERSTAGRTNQYQSGQSNRRQDAARQDQANSDMTAGLAALVTEIL